MGNDQIIQESKQGQKAISSFKLGIFSIIIFLATTLGLYVLMLDLLDMVLGNMRYGGKWDVFLMSLPTTITAAISLIYGAEGLKSKKRVFALLGILFSLVGFLLIATWLFGGACC